MIQFQARLHPIIRLELKKSESLGFARRFIGAVADRLGLDFGEMRRYGLRRCCKGEVAFKFLAQIIERGSC